jgi:hypothetical protein
MYSRKREVGKSPKKRKKGNPKNSPNVMEQGREANFYKLEYDIRRLSEECL